MTENVSEGLLVAADVGGTKVRIEVFEPETVGNGDFANDEPVAMEVFDTPRSGDVLEDVAGMVRAVAGGREVLAVGVGCPGPLDPYAGIVLNPPNLSAEWWSLDVPTGLRKQLGCPVAIENDANLAALGEHTFGGGRDFPSTLYITVSTGVGGGLVVDGEIFGGERGFALELGHVSITDEPYPCGCGRTGCVESATSGTSIARRARERNWTPPDGGKATARSIAAAATEGDEVAYGIISGAAGYFGRALVDFIYGFDPAAIIVGGGVSQSDLFMDLTLEALDREPMMPAFRGVPVRRADLGIRSVVAGALVLADRTFAASRGTYENTHLHDVME